MPAGPTSASSASSFPRRTFATRSRHPAHDEFNAMLNYGYGVLYSMVEKACILAGLDPFVGFLHTDNYNKKSLVFDLIEPFRILSDRATLLLFTGRRRQKDFFKPVPGGIALEQARPGLLHRGFQRPPGEDRPLSHARQSP